MSNSYIVIGAAGGIGSHLCKRLVDSGNRVHAGVHSTERCGSLGELVLDTKEQVDAEDWDETSGFINAVCDKDPEVKGVVLCVGSIVLKPPHLVSRKEFDATVSKNLGSAFSVLRASVKCLPKGGSIVFISSVAANIGLPNHELIGAVKAGVASMAQSAAATYAKNGIRINCVAPGLVRTQLSERITSNPASLKFSEKMHPLGRIGEPNDVASAIQWLLDPENSWITGECISVDGGLARLKV